MGDVCPSVIDTANAATMHWLGLVAMLTVAAVLGLVGTLLHARVRIEDLEAQVERLQQKGRSNG
jgi:hypothetical protein